MDLTAADRGGRYHLDATGAVIREGDAPPVAEALPPAAEPEAKPAAPKRARTTEPKE
ncbi:hypothetical protein ACJ41P_31800 [Azospirillum argentinense]|uniref:Uncharacterized protein n=1 Tax=Azospirillum argentinense TaxID=2970906 RepID=A0ABW8VH66_9PROT